MGKKDDIKRKKILMLGYLILHTDPRVLREASALQEAGWEVEVIGLSGERRERVREMDNGIRARQVITKKYRGDSTLRYMFSYFRFAVEALLTVFGLCLRNRYAAVHVHTMPDLLVFCALPAKLFGSKIVLDVHDTVPEVYQDKFGCGSEKPLIRLLRWCEKIASKVADRVITVNHEHSKLVHARTRLTHKPTVVFNAVDQLVFAPRERPQPAPPLRNLIVHGTLAHRHGIDLLIDAMPAVLAEEPETMLRIYGSGDAVPALRVQISRLGLGESVHLSGQFHPLEEMAKFVSDSDIGIIPYRSTYSTQYMLPTKLLEYLSVGLAVVTSETLPIKSMFEGSLKIWEDGDPATLANLILEQIRNPVFSELPSEMRWSEHKRELVDFYTNIPTKH